MRVLVADDDLVSRRRLERTLIRLGHEVIVVADGKDAVAALLLPDGPRLAILDWVMPGADGLAVCRAVRQRGEPYVYVILLTASDRREDLVAGLGAEADDFLTKPFDTVELRARLRSGERVLELQERLLQAQEALRFEATYDRLTGLLRREVVLDILGRELRRAKREGRPLAVVMADLDQFKRINDTCGHASGDAVLREAADRMRGVIRDYDLFGRYGGEEFLLVLPGSEAIMAEAIAERARAAVAAGPVPVGDTLVPVTISLGIAWATPGCDEAGPLLQAADEALYQAKANGRDRVERQPRGDACPGASGSTLPDAASEHLQPRD